MRHPAGAYPDHRSGSLREGIELSVTRQLCTQIQEADFPGADLVETILEIAIRNPTPEPIAVRRDAFRLLAPDGSALRTVTWRAADPLVVGRRTTGVFRLRYMSAAPSSVRRPWISMPMQA